MNLDLDEVGRAVIRSEAAALGALAESLGDEFVHAVQRLRAAPGRVIVSGMGKSGHIARKIAATMASTGRPAMFVHPAEASHGDLGMITAQDCLLAISRSGETRELSDLVYHARRLHVPLIAMTFVAESTLAKAADVLLLLPDAGEAVEDAPAPTNSTTMCLALGDALAVAVLRANGFSASDFRSLHPGGKLGAMLSHVSDLMLTGEAMPLAQESTPVQDMLIEMTRKRLGCVGVQDGTGRLAGIVTDGDLRRRFTPDILSHTASALMTAAPVTIDPDATAADAVALMNERKITALFVTRNERPIGIVHLHDLLAAGVR